MIRSKSQRGFTLIELLVVISIIALLAMLGVGNLITSQRRARNARRISDLKSMASAMEQSHTALGYDDDHTDGIGTVMTAAAIPTDPTNGTPYGFQRATSAASDGFCFIAGLEDPFDNANCIACSCGGNDCSFTAATAPAVNESFCVTNQQ